MSNLFCYVCLAKSLEEQFSPHTFQHLSLSPRVPDMGWLYFGSCQLDGNMAAKTKTNQVRNRLSTLLNLPLRYSVLR